MRRFRRPIALVILRTCERLGTSSPQLIDDLVQDTYLKLCSDNFRLLREFIQQHPDSFAGYIKVIAANVARDYFKSARAGKRGSNQPHLDSDSVQATVPESDSGSPDSMERSLLLSEIGRELENCIEGPDRQRKALVFWLYYRVGMSASSIGALPEISLGEKGVESMLLRITRDLRKRIGSSAVRQEVGKLNSREGILSAESL